MASLNLITGVPGSGKSLYTVAEVIAKITADRIIYSNVNGLNVPGRDVLPLEGYEPDAWAAMSQAERDAKQALNNWHQWAPGNAVLVYDEAQRVWRARSQGSKVPPEIAALETIRHGGVELWIITQHPNLIDANVRRLIGRHIHVRRIWGLSRAMLYEWDHCSDLGRVSNAIKRQWGYPKKAYAWYKSAEVHNKAGGRIPVAFWLLALAALAVPAALYYASTGVIERMDVEGKIAAAKGAAVPAGAASSTPHAAQVQGQPAQVAQVTPQVESPTAAGCIKLGPRCECYDTTGRVMDVTPLQCVSSVERGGILIPYDFQAKAMPAPSRAQASAPPAGPSASSKQTPGSTPNDGQRIGEAPGPSLGQTFADATPVKP